MRKPFDVCELMSTPSIYGYLYFVTFIDDATRKCWIYFMKHKSEVFNKFCEFKSFVENQTGRSIKVSRCDNGGE